MLNIHKETIEDNAVVLKLEGDATVEHAEQLQQALLEGLQNSEQLLVDCAQTTSIDFYAIQLLCSAHRSSVSWQKTLTFQGVPTDAVKQTIKNTGFQREHGCSHCPENVTCMWAGHSTPSET